MSLRKQIFLFILIVVPLAALVTGMAFLLTKQLNQVEAAQEHRFISYQLAQELLQSSDKLTRFARTYVATGDIKFKTYFNDVLAIRNGEMPKPSGYGGVYWDLVVAGILNPPDTQKVTSISLEKEMLNIGITLEEFGLLKDAQNRSDALVSLENRAMNDLMEFKIDDDGKVTPPDRNQAIALLHGAEYHKAKGAIMEPIGEFLKMVDQRTEIQLLGLNDNAEWILFILLLSSGLMLAVFVLFILILRKRLLLRGSQLIENVNRMAEGDLSIRNPVTSHDELDRLAVAINSMAESLDNALTASNEKTRVAEDQSLELAKQQSHSEKLLNNILPVLIADRLKKGESTIAETFPEVTVLFADIVGFTRMSSQLGPRQLVSMLNDIFGRFDELTVELKLEKIKTIGDCYMVVGGVPDRSPTHCQQVADFALRAMQKINEYSHDTGQQLSIRIGIHTGTVVAGIVGKQKYSYDLWGDVVNIASRMESAGMPNMIHVTESVRIRLADDYNFESRGTVELKGKGAMNTYFLLGKKDH